MLVNVKQAMRNLILVSAISILIVSCSKDNEPGLIPNNSGIVIKGEITGSKFNSANTKSASALSLSDAEKVISAAPGRFITAKPAKK